MRGLVIALIFWIGVVPSLVGSFLILAFLAALLPPLYFALSWFVFSFTAFAVVFGPFCLVPLARSEWLFLSQYIQVATEDLAQNAAPPPASAFISLLDAFLAVRGLRIDRGVLLETVAGRH